MLGDWYANLVYSRPHQLVLCLNERSLLAVLVLAREGKFLGERFREATVGLLGRLGLRPGIIGAEALAMAEVRFGPTASRRVLGCLNEAALALSFKMAEDPPLSLAQAEDWLSEHLYSLTGGRYPRELALDLFGVPRPPRRGPLIVVH